MSKFTQQIAERTEDSTWSQLSNGEIGSITALFKSVVCTFFERLRTIEDSQMQIDASLNRIEAKLENIGSTASQSTSKEWYTPSKVADIVGKKVYTVREWCRINARKRQTGRGNAAEWEISAEEIERYKNHGLRSIPLKY